MQSGKIIKIDLNDPNALTNEQNQLVINFFQNHPDIEFVGKKNIYTVNGMQIQFSHNLIRDKSSQLNTEFFVISDVLGSGSFNTVRNTLVRLTINASDLTFQASNENSYAFQILNVYKQCDQKKIPMTLLLHKKVMS